MSELTDVVDPNFIQDEYLSEDGIKFFRLKFIMDFGDRKIYGIDNKRYMLKQDDEMKDVYKVMERYYSRRSRNIMPRRL